jgi:hypothetical protein
MHDLFVPDVAVGEDDLIDLVRPAQAFELGLLEDRDSAGIIATGERGRIAPAGNAGNLRRREGDHLACRVVAIDDIEIMKIPSRSPDDDDAAASRAAGIRISRLEIRRNRS